MEENKSEFDDQMIRANRNNYNTSMIEDEDEALLDNDGSALDIYTPNPMRKTSSKF